MPTRHAASHSLGALFSTVSAGLLVSTVSSLVPDIVLGFAHLANVLGNWTGLALASETLAHTVVIMVLGALWGVGFHYTAGTGG